jgi:5-methyltetrahydropteroyltriglutamate--homocysteine methyltransferase
VPCWIETTVTKSFRTTVVGSYPRPVQPADTLKKSSLSRAEADDIIRWAVRDQAGAGLDIVADGEGRRENMFYFVQRRVDGISFEQMEFRTFGKAGFGIEIPTVVDKIQNPSIGLAHDWKVAREAAPSDVEVKLTCIGPHMLAKYSRNSRTDLYATDRDLAFAYATILNQEMQEAVRIGCEFIQFDEPAWMAFPEDAKWAAEALNQATANLKVKVGLHVCGGNPRRKRVFFTHYHDLADAFAIAKIDQISLEYCTLDYNMLTLWEKWKFDGEFAAGVIDQRGDEIESSQVVARRTRPILDYFEPGRLLLSSECGFQHVPLDITRGKMRSLVNGAKYLRSELAGSFSQ